MDWQACSERALIAEIDHQLRHRARASLQLWQILAPQIDPAQQAYGDLLQSHLAQTLELAESINEWLLVQMAKQVAD
ncbi:hypothetical protein [Herpetosiphon gulosus]|uniref:Uncharacterized protein n=1 Tax=Herpetosiphon gulosus TaxID=1973496 RepID=A0ABP9WYG9_9CHLR